MHPRTRVSYVRQGQVSIAAIVQKDPQVLLTHPETKAKKLEDLKPLTLFVSKERMTSYFQWLKSEYGFSEKNVRRPLGSRCPEHARCIRNLVIEATSCAQRKKVPTAVPSPAGHHAERRVSPNRSARSRSRQTKE